MERQRVRLTDQALVAWTLARRRAANPSVVDLVLGLAAESEGAASQLLSPMSAALSRLSTLAVPADLTRAHVALAWAAADTGDGRPAWTIDLLRAAIEVGGFRLADALDAAGVAAQVPRDARLVLDPFLAGELGQTRETFGLAGDDGLDPHAGLLVARTRALGGEVIRLLEVCAADPWISAPPWHHLEVAREGVRLTDGPPEARLGEVITAARRWCVPELVRPEDLIRAAELVGGERVQRLAAACHALVAAEPSSS